MITLLSTPTSNPQHQGEQEAPWYCGLKWGCCYHPVITQGYYGDKRASVQCQFVEHKSHCNNPGTEPGPWACLLQLAVSLVAAISTVASGMSLGFSAIALPELLRAESPDHLDIDEASWFGKAPLLLRTRRAFSPPLTCSVICA